MPLALAACGGDAQDDVTSAAADASERPTEVAYSSTVVVEASADDAGAEGEPADPAETTSSPSPEPTTEANEEGADPAPQSPALPFPAEGEAVPGRYTHSTIAGFELSVDASVSVLLNADHLVVLAGGDMARDFSQGIAFIEALGIIPPSEVGVHQDHHPTVPDVTMDLPENLSVWFDRVPQIEVVDTAELTVAGEPAQRWTVVLDTEAGPTFADCGSPACIGFIVNEGGGTYVLRSDEIATIYQLDALPGTIGWSFGLDQAGADQAVAAFDELLRTLKAT
ncbi:MAG: hypothetical protein AAF467_15610 [Actinomycetota bacterium]